MSHRNFFGSYSRATDGVIVTFCMPDRSVEVRHFRSIMTNSGQRQKGKRRRVVRDKSHIEQVVEWADAHQAKVVSMSTPETILRDLQGTRANLEPRGRNKHTTNFVSYPERTMLKGRIDLLEATS